MFYSIVGFDTGNAVSMKSGLEGRNNLLNIGKAIVEGIWSQ